MSVNQFEGAGWLDGHRIRPLPWKRSVIRCCSSYHWKSAIMQPFISLLQIFIYTSDVNARPKQTTLLSLFFHPECLCLRPLVPLLGSSIPRHCSLWTPQKCCCFSSPRSRLQCGAQWTMAEWGTEDERQKGNSGTERCLLAWGGLT